jgi:hypothetical protein
MRLFACALAVGLVVLCLAIWCSHDDLQEIRSNMQTSHRSAMLEELK